MCKRNDVSTVSRSNEIRNQTPSPEVLFDSLFLRFDSIFHPEIPSYIVSEIEISIKSCEILRVTKVQSLVYAWVPTTERKEKERTTVGPSSMHHYAQWRTSTVGDVPDEKPRAQAHTQEDKAVWRQWGMRGRAYVLLTTPSIETTVHLEENIKTSRLQPS
ncbi:hypothetical protein C0Q70_16832 [Pomacea canaliculata]|uniref:Uncharacterized protein n=1 Tax=Pomacea canaliculata TaxID=400727 RepID=A0A2T7NQW3_POMCA|nr:hypothetical protein C0Q70_16832 [Pomacea canaliculata]